MVSNGSHVEGADFVREESKSLEGIATYSHESSSGPHRGRQPWGQLFLCREHQQCTIHSKLLQIPEIFPPTLCPIFNVDASINLFPPHYANLEYKF